LSIPYNRQGIVQLIFDQQQYQRWEKTQSVRQRQGFRLERWGRREALAHFPFLEAAKDVESGQPFMGAIYSPSDRQLDPVALTQACRLAAIQNGAQIHYNSPVEIFETIKADCHSQVSGIRVKGKDIPLDVIIVSAGLDSTLLTAHLDQEIPISPVLGQALRLKLASPWPIPTPVINGAHVHLVPVNSHELWVGATVEFPDLDAGKSFEANPKTLEQLRQQAIALYPELARAEVVESWSGLRPRPVERAAPIIGWLPNYQNVIVATGHYRNGVLLAPVTASYVEEMLAPSERSAHPER
jgi:glycine/D-amino acid oxidase-like deaminating enzyme